MVGAWIYNKLAPDYELITPNIEIPELKASDVPDYMPNEWDNLNGKG